MTQWAIAFIASTAFAAVGFVVVAIMWLKKLRETLSLALGETAGQQLRSSQRIGETIAQLQRQQQLTDQRLQTLAETSLRLRQELDQLAGKVEMTERDCVPHAPTRLLH